MARFACNTLEVELNSAGVAEITLQRPQVHNALNAEMIAELTTILEELKADDAVRVLCLQGAGSSFCAGADLAWMQKTIEYSAQDNMADAVKLANMLRALYDFPKPTVAIIQGAVYGGGLGLVACCDMAIADINSQFCLAETKLGLVPATISPYVIHAIGARAFQYWTLLAAPFSANQALNMGLLHEVLGNGVQLAVSKKNIIQQLLSNGPAALVLAKQLVKRLTAPVLDVQFHQELAELIASVRIGEEAQNRMLAFLKKHDVQ